jgi:hypothetical protein
MFALLRRLVDRDEKAAVETIADRQTSVSAGSRWSFDSALVRLIINMVIVYKERCYMIRADGTDVSL